MQTNSNFMYTISLSKDAYRDKKISDAMVRSGKDEENRKIREEYGFAPRKGVGFERVSVTPEEHLNYLLEGHVFCHLFDINTDRLRKDNTFGSSEKKNENFVGSQLICVDIDKTSYPNVEAFVEKLIENNIEPTFYYTTYSNLQKDDEGKDKGARFRLVYVFEYEITEPYMFRYSASKLNKKIEEATGEEIKDKCSLNCSQFFNGTCKDNPDLKVSYGCSNKIYEFSDFEAEMEDYKEFLKRCADYSQPKLEKKIEIKALLKKYTNKDYIWSRKAKSFVEAPDITIPITDYSEASNIIEESDYSQLSEIIFYSWDNMTEDDFKKNGAWKHTIKNLYKYLFRVEKEWANGKWFIADDDYFTLFHYTEKLKDGQQRRKTIYQRICLRRIMKPEISRDEMLFNVLIDVMRYFDNSDKCLCSDVIRDLIDNAFKLTIEEVKDSMAKQVEYLKANTRPKRGLVYINKDAHTKETTFETLDGAYNIKKTVAENIEGLNKAGFMIKKSWIYEYLKTRGIKPVVKGKASDEEIKALIDSTQSSKANIELLKEKGIKVRKSRLLELLKEKKAENVAKIA